MARPRTSSGLRDACRLAAPLLVCAALGCALVGAAAAALGAGALGVGLAAWVDGSERRALRSALGSLLPAEPSPRAVELSALEERLRQRIDGAFSAFEERLRQRIDGAFSRLELAVAQEGTAQRWRMGRLLRRSEARIRHIGRELQDGFGRQAAAALAASAGAERRALRTSTPPSAPPPPGPAGTSAPPPDAAERERQALRELTRQMTYLLSGLSQHLDGVDSKMEQRLLAIERSLDQLRTLVERLAMRNIGSAEHDREIGDGLDRVDARLEALREVSIEQQRVLARAIALRQADQGAMVVALDRLRSELGLLRGPGRR